jgi:hypothetical protein
MRLAYFVTPHGFGHAARACAVMQAVHALDPDVEFDLYAGTPRWLFEQSLGEPVRYVALETDVGLRQASALEVDVGATLAALRAFLPLDPSRVASLARELTERRCSGVLCDISPLGIEVAQAAGLPSFLIENFTWDWIYEPMLAQAPALGSAIEQLREIYSRATRRVQMRPACAPRDDADLTVDPVGRLPRRSRDETRDELGIPPDHRVVAVTLGGMRESMDYLDRLRRFENTTFIVTGMDRTRREGNLLLYDNDTPLYMPDLIRASDALVAKLGYSTLAEAHQQGLPLAWITRSAFRETPVLSEFAERNMAGFEVTDEAFRGGDWVERIEELLALPARGAAASEGAAAVARFVLEVVGAERGA